LVPFWAGVNSIKDDKMMEFRGSFTDLQRWARFEGLLKGQRNKGLVSVYAEIRNSVAHLRYQLLSPIDSARKISDLAEIINQMWGHSTPGGRLYPAPLEREVVVIAWGDGEFGPTKQQMRADQLIDFHEAGDWTCLVLRAVPHDELWEFDAEFERTKFPSELLWGPGSTEDALAWLGAENPWGDTVEYLDRLFAVQILDGKLLLPRRIEITLSLPLDLTAGRWFVVRADFPNDAFASVRQIVNAETEKSESFKRGEMEIEFEGGWLSFADKFAKDFKIIELAKPFRVRVPPFSEGTPKIEPR
jgi:hypothetical protein